MGERSRGLLGPVTFWGVPCSPRLHVCFCSFVFFVLDLFPASSLECEQLHWNSPQIPPVTRGVEIHM